MDVVLTIFAPLGFAFLALAMYYRYRKRMVAEVAERLGLEFSPSNNAFEELGGFYLTRMGKAPNIENCIRGTADGTEVRIFEYRCYFIEAVASHTVALLTDDDLQLPKFLVRPRHRLSILDPYSSLGPPPVMISEDFDRRWIVAGEDIKAVRRLFDEELRKFVDTNKWWMEGEGRRLALYRWNYTVNHAFLEDFFHTAYKALLLLKSRSASNAVVDAELAEAGVERLVGA